MLTKLLSSLGWSGLIIALILLMVGSMVGAHAIIESLVSALDGSCVTVAEASICVDRSSSGE